MVAEKVKRSSGGIAENGKWLILTESMGEKGKGFIHSCGTEIMGKKIPLTEQDTISKMLDPLAGGGEVQMFVVPYCPKCEREPSHGWIDIDTGKRIIA